MAFDLFLADRVAQFFKERNVPFEDKKMFGGLCFLVDDKMCVGVMQNEIMARIDPAVYKESLQREGCKEMNFTGRPMKGFVFLSDEAIDLDDNLHYWLQLSLDFNPKAKASPKKKKKNI